MFPHRAHLLLGLALCLLLPGCAPQQAPLTGGAPAGATAVSQTGPTQPPIAATDRPLPAATAVPTAIPTDTAMPTSPPTAAPTATPTPTATPIGPCVHRMPGDDLLTVVTTQYGLSRDYAPSDLVPLADYLPMQVTRGYPSEIRAVALEPLVQMVSDMLAEGLQPWVMSGYRSYAAQAIAWNKWSTLYPERVSIISAQPGHSEHQLGTAVDFGSPELDDIVGQPGIEFHTYFYKTREGQWLLANAHKYGFTLSYTAEAFDITGFYYEPWHYRYVGVEMATQLHASGQTLTEFQLSSQPIPCTN